MSKKQVWRSAEHKVKKLRVVDSMLASVKSVGKVLRSLGINEVTPPDMVAPEKSLDPERDTAKPILMFPQRFPLFSKGPIEKVRIHGRGIFKCR